MKSKARHVRYTHHLFFLCSQSQCNRPFHTLDLKRPVFVFSEGGGLDLLRLVSCRYSHNFSICTSYQLIWMDQLSLRFHLTLDLALVQLRFGAYQVWTCTRDVIDYNIIYEIMCLIDKLSFLIIKLTRSEEDLNGTTQRSNNVDIKGCTIRNVSVWSFTSIPS